MIGDGNVLTYILMVLLTLLAVITVAIVRQRNMFGVVILAGIYSFLMASVMLLLDAVDVAMTEASVGAGISTVLFIAALYLTNSQEYPRARHVIVPMFVSLVVGGALVWGMFSLPPFGVDQTPMHTHTVDKYIKASKDHEMPPNIVTAVLADFRGFDTLGEVTVIFVGGLGVLMLLSGRRKKKSIDDDEKGEEAQT